MSEVTALLAYYIIIYDPPQFVLRGREDVGASRMAWSSCIRRQSRWMIGMQRPSVTPMSGDFRQPPAVAAA
eukprot:2230986-Pyramimonas_sp.AAC.2